MLEPCLLKPCFHVAGICTRAITVGFHNFNLRIFNLRVSNPNKSIVDAFLTRCRISMCQGLGPKEHDEISEIDCTSVYADTPVFGGWRTANSQLRVI